MSKRFKSCGGVYLSRAAIRATSDIPIGGFFYETDNPAGELRLYMRLPIEERYEGEGYCHVTIAAGKWEWNGNREKPTLSPSIELMGRNPLETLWHGYLKDGIFEACE